MGKIYDSITWNTHFSMLTETKTVVGLIINCNRNKIQFH